MPAMESNRLAHVVDGGGAFGAAEDIDVVQKREQIFSFDQVKFHFRQCVVNGKTKQQWHQWVTLFTPFFLVDSVPLPVCILPRIRCGGTVRLSHEWQEMAQTGDFQQLRHHRSTVHMVVCSDSIHRQHCGHRIRICRCSHCVANAIHQARVERANWKWSASCFHFGAGANVLATNRLNDVPVAMPLTPPSRFCNAVRLAIMNALNIEAGTSARAKSSAAAWKCNKLSLSSNKTRNISLEHRLVLVGPPGLHTTTRKLQTRTFERPGASNTTKIPRETPQRENNE